MGCGFTPVNHFTASGVHAQQGNAAESQEREMHAGLQHTPSGHSCAPGSWYVFVRGKTDPAVVACFVLALSICSS